MKSRSLAAVFFLAVLFLTGCGLFEPRTPDKPGSGAVPWISPTEPETVFVNVKRAIEGKVVENYVRSLTTDFAFHPDPSDSTELSATRPGIFDDWTVDGAERQVSQAILDQASSLSLTFTQRDAPIYVSADDAVFFLKYELRVVYKAGGADVFYGLADFLMRRETDQFWYVYTWIDKRDPDFPANRTWGYLKGTKR
ncbi:MAG: hypothetical protein V2A71_02475 [Candidatus Eisenbacteria bacterium]